MSDTTAGSRRLPPESPTKTATSGTSTAETPIGSDGWHSFKAQTEACYIVFGVAGMGAADSSDWPIDAGTSEEWYVPPRITHFRVIATSSGALHWDKSS